jgi:hypothetical protein
MLGPWVNRLFFNLVVTVHQHAGYCHVHINSAVMRPVDLDCFTLETICETIVGSYIDHPEICKLFVRSTETARGPCKHLYQVHHPLLKQFSPVFGCDSVCSREIIFATDVITV